MYKKHTNTEVHTSAHTKNFHKNKTGKHNILDKDMKGKNDKAL